MAKFEPKPFGKYFLTDRIAVGGMAEIYKAKTYGVDGFEKTLAIKKILSNYSLDKDFITMLTDEAKLVVNLSHPNIVQVYDLGRVGDDYFISMEFIDGMNVRELINRASELGEEIPLDVAIYIALEVCKGLDYAHSKLGPDGKPLEIVHRDVSPHNILVSFEGEIKIVDFGIAKAARNVSQTQFGTLKGKVTYMSPEQALGKPIDHRTDIFSTGIVLYEMLTAERLFTGDSQMEVIEKIRQTKIDKNFLKEKISSQVLNTLAKALSHSLNGRHKTAAEMQVELTRVLYSQYPDFTPRRLADLLQKWFGKQKLQESSISNLSQSDASRLADQQAKDIEQVTLVHREITMNEKVKNEDTLNDRSWHPDDLRHDATGQLEVSGSFSTEQVSQTMKHVGFGKSKLPKWILGVLFFLILILAGVYFFGPGTSGPKNNQPPVVVDDPPKIPDVETAIVRIETEPKGADVFLDSKDALITTPGEIEDWELDREYKLEFKLDGYLPFQQVVKISEKPKQPLRFVLQKIPPKSYKLNVVSHPAGAKIFLDGKDTGKVTPAEFDGFEFKKKYSFTLKKEDYVDYLQDYSNENPKDQALDIKLKAVPYASLLVTSEPVGAKVFINGNDSGYVTPHTIEKITLPQSLDISVRADDFVAASKKVAIQKEGKADELGFKLKPVLHDIEIKGRSRYARVKINDKDYGKMPVKASLPKGEYKITVSQKGYQDYVKTITLPGDEKNFSVRLKKKPEPVSKTPKNTQPKNTTPKSTTPRTTNPPVKSSGSNVAAYGKLRIDSSPRGAAVSINGSKRGITPIVVRNLPKNQALRVTVSKPGYRTWSTTLTLRRDYTEVSAGLRR